MVIRLVLIIDIPLAVSYTDVCSEASCFLYDLIYMLTTKVSIRIHINEFPFVHLGERPFECNVCKKTFTQKGALQLHERTHEELRPYQCADCPMRFSQKGNLRAHSAVCIICNLYC